MSFLREVDWGRVGALVSDERDDWQSDVWFHVSPETLLLQVYGVKYLLKLCSHPHGARAVFLHRMPDTGGRVSSADVKFITQGHKITNYWFIYQIFIEYLLCAQNSSRCWGCSFG